MCHSKAQTGSGTPTMTPQFWQHTATDTRILRLITGIRLERSNKFYKFILHSLYTTLIGNISQKSTLPPATSDSVLKINAVMCFLVTRDDIVCHLLFPQGTWLKLLRGHTEQAFIPPDSFVGCYWRQGVLWRERVKIYINMGIGLVSWPGRCNTPNVSQSHLFWIYAACMRSICVITCYSINLNYVYSYL